MRTDLRQGDCLELMKAIPDGSIDLTVTSPPYDDLRKYNGFSYDAAETAGSLYRVTKDGGVVVYIVGDKTSGGSESGTSFRTALTFMNAGFLLHDTMIYYKSNPMPHVAQNRYTQAFEYMFVFSKGKPTTTNMIRVPCKYASKVLKTYTTNPESIRRPNRETATKETRIKHNVWNYTLAGTNHGHPAIFPYQLAHDHIVSWSNEGDTVLDPFMGSGTTGVACKNLNRNFIGMELERSYYDIAVKRIEEIRS